MCICLRTFHHWNLLKLLLGWAIVSINYPMINSLLYHCVHLVILNLHLPEGEANGIYVCYSFSPGLPFIASMGINDCILQINLQKSQKNFLLKPKEKDITLMVEKNKKEKNCIIFWIWTHESESGEDDFLSKITHFVRKIGRPWEKSNS